MKYLSLFLIPCLVKKCSCFFFQNLQFCVRSESSGTSPNLKDLQVVYEELRKLWSQLPV